MQSSVLTAGMRLFLTAGLFFSFILIRSQEIKHVAVSSDITFCFRPCKPNSLYKIQHGNVTIFIRCHSNYQIPDKFEGRISVNESTGCVSISKATKSDGGLYILEHKNGEGIKETQRQITYALHDKVWIRELSRNTTDGNISLTVVCAGEPGAIIWTLDGGDLPDGHWLSADNRTLTTPYKVTCVITINASNLVSGEHKNITLINDLGEKPAYLGRIMYLNITRVIWEDGGGQDGDRTLVLPRNVTTLYVITAQEVHPSRDRKFLLLLFSVIPVVIVVGFCILKHTLIRGSAATQPD